MSISSRILSVAFLEVLQLLLWY